MFRITVTAMYPEAIAKRCQFETTSVNRAMIAAIMKGETNKAQKMIAPKLKSCPVTVAWVLTVIYTSVATLYHKKVVLSII